RSAVRRSFWPPSQWYSNPRAVKVGCLHSNPQVDQHLCRFNAVSLDRDSRHNGPDASEHFAPDLPRIVSSTPRIGHLRTGKCPADGIHYLTTHGFTLGLVVYGIGATSFAESVGFLQINQNALLSCHHHHIVPTSRHHCWLPCASNGH